MKKILYLQGHARYAREWGILGEIIQTLKENSENDVYYMDCNNTFNGFCWLTQNYHWGYCKKCQNGCHKILEHLNFSKKKILKIEKVKIPQIPRFSSIQEALQYEKDGYHIAFGAINCLMTALRDYDFDIKKYRNLINKFISVEYTTLKNLENFFNEYKFDEIHTFNGRFSLNHPLVEFAQKKGIPYTTYEFGANLNKYSIYTNNVPHDFYHLKNEIIKYWQNSNDENKEILAKKWFEERRAGKFQATESFTKKQIKNLLPKDFDFKKENIVFFNSSIDEVYAFECWKHPFVKNENELLFNLFEHYKDDNSKHFYLRVHPNLTKAKKMHTTQIKQINEMKKKYKNLTVIEPDEKIDTYALMDVADKVVTVYSTTGFEASYYGKISIFAGKAPYEDLDCCYQANSLEELYNLIDSKNLKPKPKENTYAYAYYNQVYGENYKYYIINSLNDGNFMGLEIDSKHKMKYFK